MPNGVLLDIDGTLLLSNEAHARSWVEAFAQLGYPASLERAKYLVGMGGDKFVPELIPGFSESEGVGKEANERRKQIFQERYAPHLKPAPGARELVQRLRDEGLRLVVATSASGEEMEMLLKLARVDDLLPTRTTSSEVEQSKPAPDVVEAALEKTGLPAGEVIMLGDTPWDVQSSTKAGVAIIALRCGGHSDDDLSGAIAVYDDPADLLAQYETSPLAQSNQPLPTGSHQH